jgi:phosphate:Na+ symporter
MVIREHKEEEDERALRFVDDRLLKTPPVALMQVKKELNYMISLVEESLTLSFTAVDTASPAHGEKIRANEEIIDFTNSALNKFLIKLSANVDPRDEKLIGSYFHVINDLERIGDHAENFSEIAAEMSAKKIAFSDQARGEIAAMRDDIMHMFAISKDAFTTKNRYELPTLAELEEGIDGMKKQLIASHFARLAEGNCSMDVSPYYSSLISGMERVADHLVNVGFSIENPIGSQRESEIDK